MSRPNPLHVAAAVAAVSRTRIYLTAVPLAALCVWLAFAGVSHAATVEETLFNTSDTPTTLTENDTAAVELGLKFRPSVDGEILGIRFYKGPQNTRTHTGTLWSSTGSELATATFSGESASGWQEARFASPVSVTAGTTYVASYHTSVGYYSYDSNYFATDHVSGSLTAPSSVNAGGNGTYVYGNHAFPSQTWYATNYWVDAIFVADEGATPPTNIFTDNFDAALSWTTADNVTWYTGSPKNGSHSVRLRRRGSIEEVISTVGYEDITVSFTMGAYSLDNSNENVQTLYFDGSSWTVLADIGNNTPNENKQLNPYTVALPASVEDNSSFALRFKLNGSGTGDYGYIDDVVVRGTPKTSGPTPPTASLTADPTSIVEGYSSTVTWSSTDADSCVATGFTTGNSTSGSVSVSPTSDTNYTLACTGVRGTDSDTTSVTVIPNLTAAASVVPNTGTAPLTVDFTGGGQGGNGTYTYSWDFGDGSANSIEQYPSHTYTTDGLYAVTLTVTSGTQTDSEMLTVTVTAPPSPTATLSANPTSITSGQSSTLTWSSIDATSCLSTGFATGGVIAGSVSVSLTSDTTYTLACTGAGGTDSDSATVVVLPAPTSEQETIWGSRTTTSFNQDGGNDWDLGMIFTPTVDGQALGTRVYGAPDESGAHTARLWRNSDGALLAGPYNFTYSGQGWHEFTFPTPVTVYGSNSYTVTVSTGEDSAHWYTAIASDLVSGGDNGRHLTYPVNAAVYSETLGIRPTKSYQSENYLRDVMFTEVELPPDTEEPTTPTNLVASPVSRSKISLSWNASSDKRGVTGYTIYRDGAELTSISGTVTAYSSTGLTPETTYSYAVTASDAAGNISVQSTAAVATTLAAGSTGGNFEVGQGADLGGAQVLSGDSAWNTPVDIWPLHPQAASILAGSGPTAGIKSEFASAPYQGALVGIPYYVVPENQPLKTFTCDTYCDGRDEGPLPYPDDMLVEGDNRDNSNEYNDQHSIVIQKDSSTPNGLGNIFELFQAERHGVNWPSIVDYWTGYQSKWDSNAGDFQRGTNNSNSTDAAGLPIFPGLVRYDEVARAVADYNNGGEGVIPHALRFTVAPGYTKWAITGNATHCAGWNAGVVPFGARFRLKSSFDISGFSPETQVLLRTFKKYGIIMADNGGGWFVTGAPDSRWNDTDLRIMQEFTHGTDFEMVDTGPITACTP